MGSVIVLDKYPILLPVRSDDFFENSDIITLNQAPADTCASVEMQMALVVVANYSEYMNFLILAFQFKLDL
jgi:hypothetical protein